MTAAVPALGVSPAEGSSAVTASIRRFYFHPSFPVDARHNAKIFRDRLAVWAATQTAVEIGADGGEGPSGIDRPGGGRGGAAGGAAARTA
jgi:hypothetical protein